MYELRVDGMTCTGCANSVKKAVQMVDSNAEVNVDLISKTVKVKSDAALDAVKSAIDDAGYTVTDAADIH
jgi:copper chaperone